jgi:hypothetical protein
MSWIVPSQQIIIRLGDFDSALILESGFGIIPSVPCSGLRGIQLLLVSEPVRAHNAGEGIHFWKLWELVRKEVCRQPAAGKGVELERVYH